MILNICLPAFVFFLQLPVGKTKTSTAHLDKAEIRTALHIILQGNSLTRTELIQYLTEKGIVDSGLTLNYRIIMIQNKTGKFQQRNHLPDIIADGKAAYNPDFQELAISPLDETAKLCYDEIGR